MAAAVAEPPSSAKEDDLPSPSSSSSPSPSPSPLASPTQSPSLAGAAASAAADMNPNGGSSPDHDPCSPTKSDPASDPPPPAAIHGRLPPSQAAFPAASATRRLPPPCWTQEETDALIQSYRHKWYALRRGNLRASHWEEVAEAVARGCRHLYTASAGANSPKTAVQCRHKMEKLRKRYRSEKRRPHRTSWVHFREMDAMEMGTQPGGGGGGAPTTAPRSKAVVAAAPIPDAYSDDDQDDESDDDDDGEEEEEDEEEDGPKSVGGNPTTRSIHAVMSKENGMAAMGGDPRFQIPKAVRSKAGMPRADDRAKAPNHPFNPKSFHASGSNGFSKGFPGSARKLPPVAEEMRRRLADRRRNEREGSALGEMVAAVRMVGDGFMRVEEMKMEMAREMEKMRMEMELKRTEMIIESQRWIVDAFVKGLTHGQKKKKRAKITPE
uniref:Myb/SANT-like DNA-binding domain-containing protein n=1 Tax=Anthurium amnicola TaxID=1678845 RepID=A0A1D1YZH3_9ARAE